MRLMIQFYGRKSKLFKRTTRHLKPNKTNYNKSDKFEEIKIEDKG